MDHHADMSVVAAKLGQIDAETYLDYTKEDDEAEHHYEPPRCSSMSASYAGESKTNDAPGCPRRTCLSKSTMSCNKRGGREGRELRDECADAV